MNEGRDYDVKTGYDESSGSEERDTTCIEESEKQADQYSEEQVHSRFELHDSSDSGEDSTPQPDFQFIEEPQYLDDIDTKAAHGLDEGDDSESSDYDSVPSKKSDSPSIDSTPSEILWPTPALPLRSRERTLLDSS